MAHLCKLSDVLGDEELEVLREVLGEHIDELEALAKQVHRDPIVDAPEALTTVSGHYQHQLVMLKGIHRRLGASDNNGRSGGN